MRFVFDYLSAYKKESIIAPLFKMLEATLELFVPIIVAAIIDTGIAKSDVNYILRMCLVLIVFALFGFACAVTAQYFAAKAAIGASTDIRQDLFSKMLSFSFERKKYFDNDSLLNRMTSDVIYLQDAINMFLRLFLRSPFLVVGALVASFFVDVKSGWIFAGVIILVAAVISAVTYLNVKRQGVLQKKMDLLVMKIMQSLRGARVIRAFSIQDVMSREYNETLDSYFVLKKKTGNVSAVLSPITYVLVNIALILILYRGGNFVNAGILSTGSVVALVNYMSQILIELTKISVLIVMLSKAVPSADRINEVLSLDDIRDVNSAISIDCGDKSIEVSDLSYKYSDSAQYALCDVSFRINSGMKLGIIGPTASGKSTLVRELLKQFDACRLGDRLGFVPQKVSFFNGSVADNISLGKTASNEEMMRALSIACADDFIREKGGLNAEISAGGANLSGGQAKRLAVARALVGKPDFLILDDASSALDFATERKLFSNLKNMENKPTMVVVTQKPSNIIDADEIIVLSDARVVGCGTHKMLLDTCEEYREIYKAFESTK